MNARAGWRRHRRPLLRLGHGLALGAAAAGLLLLVRGSQPVRLLEARTFDLRSRWSADPPRADTTLVFIDIDPASLRAYRDRLGRWPWPRDAHAALLRYLHAAGVRLVVFDVMFPEADVRDPGADSAFAAALEASGRAVLPVLFARVDTAGAPASTGDGKASQPGEALAPFALGPAGESGAAPMFNTAEPPHPLFLAHAAAVGAVNLDPDPDGVVRSDRLVYRYGGSYYPSLALAAARRLEPGRFGGAPVVADGSVRLRGTRIPTDGERLLLRWRGPYLEDGHPTYRIYPAFRILNSFAQVRSGRQPDVPLSALRGKVAFVGVTGAGTLEFDASPTPLRAFEPGMMIHAAALDELLHEDWLVRAGAAADGALIAGTALGIAGLTALATPWLAVTGSLALLGLVAGGAFAAFDSGLWLGLAAPLLAGALALLSVLALNWATEGRDRRRVRELFGRYVSPEYVRRLADDAESVRLGGERRQLTLLFSDIRDFTSLAEKLPAEEVLAVLNEYLDRMAAVVFEHGGTLDKFMGDAVMAFWGAPVPDPRHATRAVEAALAMLEETEVLNRAWRERGLGVEFRIGIGIHTGEAVVGNIGSLSRKLDYTAIGDAVNLASRLEALNKTFGSRILVSEATRAAVDGAYDFRSLDDVRVRGKEEPVKIHELRGPGARPAGRRPARATTGFAIGLLALLLPAPGQAQGKARWTDLVYRPAAEATGLAEAGAGPDSLDLVALVEVYSSSARWRAEIRSVEEGETLGSDPLVLVGDGRDAQVLTPLGATPLDEHASGRDPLVRAITARLESGAGPPPASGTVRLAIRAPSGAGRWIVLRRAAARPGFADALLETGQLSRLSRRLAGAGIQAAAGERRKEVVASAGARGVVTVHTVNGELRVSPDTAAIAALDRLEPSIVDLERFWRLGGLLEGTAGPPPPSGGDADPSSDGTGGRP